MNSMRLFIAIISTFISVASFAGGGGGGGVLMGLGASQGREIVYNLGQNDGKVHFAYGQLVDRQWQVRHVEMPVSDIAAEPKVMSALQVSQTMHSWEAIQ